ncbi:MAG TPA: single-stranded DNA-binding protein [Anaerolineaceae bacterium]|nr:single-stranded DNA-binding protein [Anaerolineaceae bacterium]
MWHTIIIVGNLGRDPEMRFTPNGQAVTSFSVATSRQYTSNSGQQVKETIWFRVSAWGKLAETCNQYLKKGSKVLVEGRLTADPNTGNPRIYNRQDGTAGTSFEVSAATVRFLTSRAETEGGMSQGGEESFSPIPGGEEEIPF